MHIVIIGNSVNAVTAAAHLRRHSEKNHITIIDASPNMEVATCGLNSFLKGDISQLDELSIASPQILQDIFHIRLLLNTEILQIDTNKQILYLRNNQKISYDKLLFATSPLHLRPDIKGILGDNIFTLHNATATQLANDYFWGVNAKKILILGGSRLGIQTALALAKNEAEVTIVEQSSQPLSYIDKEFAQLVIKALQNYSIKILTSTTVKEFHNSYALLSDNKHLNYDMAIITTGSHNDIRLPVTADIKLGSTGGILVDNKMQTNIKNIYACGEGIELKNFITNQPFRIRNASLSAQTAKIAADNILGLNSKLPLICNNELIDISEAYMGICGCSEHELISADIPYYAVWLNTDIYENYVSHNSEIKAKLLFNHQGTILGAQLFGTQGVFTRLNLIASLIQQHQNINKLSSFYLSYIPNLARSKDTINILGSIAQDILSARIQTIRIEDLSYGNILLNLGQPLEKAKDYPFNIINMSFLQLRAQFSSLPKNQFIALYCRNGYSAYLAYCLLHNHHFDNVFLLNSPWKW